MRSRSWALGAVCVVLALGCLSLGGCNKAPFKVVPVSGKVTLDGKPVPELHVVFSPLRTRQDDQKAGTGSSGTTNADGVYELTMSDASHAKGAVVGRHQVTFARPTPPSQGDAGPGLTPDPVLDPILTEILRKPKQVDVPAGGAKDLNIEMK